MLPFSLKSLAPILKGAGVMAAKAFGIHGLQAAFLHGGEHGANVGQLKRDLKKPELAKRIDDDTAEARSFGFDATPTFVINGVSVRGAAPLDEFEDVLRRVSRSGGQEAPCAACDKKKQ